MTTKPTKASKKHEKTLKIAILAIVVVLGMLVVGVSKDIPVYEVHKEVTQ